MRGAAAFCYAGTAQGRIRDRVKGMRAFLGAIPALRYASAGMTAWLEEDPYAARIATTTSPGTGTSFSLRVQALTQDSVSSPAAASVART